MASSLRQGGYDRATGLAQADLDRDLTAQRGNLEADRIYGDWLLDGDRANQQRDLSLAALQLEADRANQSAALSAQGMQADWLAAGFDRSLSADLANQRAAQADADRALAATQAWNRSLLDQHAIDASDAELMMAVGDRLWQHDQLVADQGLSQLDALNLRGAVLGITPYGQTQTQTGRVSGGGDPFSAITGLMRLIPSLP